MSAAPEDVRTALRAFASGVTVITCRAGGLDHAMTATAFTAVSLRPPLVAVCVAHTARFDEAISGADDWAVNILREEAREEAVWFSTPGRPLQGQLDRVAHHRADSGVGLLDRSLAWLQCRTERIVDAGDHSIVVGTVVSVRKAGSGKPLLYWEAGYRGIAAWGGGGGTAP